MRSNPLDLRNYSSIFCLPADERLSHELDLSVCQPYELELLQYVPMNSLWITRDELLKYLP